MAAKRDFTDRFLKAIKPAPKGKRIVYWDAVVPGFGLRVSDKSSAENVGAFVLVRRFPGSSNPAPRRIGDYPAMTLADARNIAREWRDDLERGVDPKVKEAERQRSERARRDDTFQAAFKQFARVHLGALRTGKVVEGVVKLRVTPKWGDWPLTDIKRRHVIELIDEIAEETPINANRILAYLKTFFGWCVDRDKLEVSPAARVRRPTRETKRDRVLKEAEIQAIWTQAGKLGAFGRAIRFMLVTAQRRTEVGSLAWREIHKEKALWTLPRERAKADRAHEVPLSAFAVEILDDCPKLAGNAYVFSTGRVRKAETNPKSTGRPLSGWGKAKAKLDELLYEAAKKAAEKAGEEIPEPFPEWHLHDLRRSAATYMAKLGIDRIVISKVLNHSDGSVTAVYDRHRYDEQKKRALELWGEHLRAIVAGQERSNVVSFADRVSA